MAQESATAIVRAFEEFSLGHYESSAKLVTKEDLKRDIKELELNTKKDLAELELKLNEKISTAKWQVLGAIVVSIILPIFLKHFGY